MYDIMCLLYNEIHSNDYKMFHIEFLYNTSSFFVNLLTDPYQIFKIHTYS